MMDSLQLNRRANLRHVLDVLQCDGFTSIESQGTVLGLDWRVLQGLLKGKEITAAFARELEWLTQRPQGWLDDDHRGERLEE